MEGFFGQKKPHFTIKLPLLTRFPGTLQYGVSADRIAAFWEARIREKNTYAFFSAKYNCTGCVWEALKAGGLGYYHDIPDSIFIQGAAGLLEAVDKAKANLKKLNECRKPTHDKMVELLNQHSDVDKSVPTLAEWMKASNQNLKFGAVTARNDQVAALDKLIKEYPTIDTNTMRLVTLFRMQGEIYSYLTFKPNGDRKVAVERLGARVTAVLSRLPNNFDLNTLTDGQFRSVMQTVAWRFEYRP